MTPLQHYALWGQILASGATVVAVVLAIVELARRRKERSRDRRSDAAAKALVALTRVCDAEVAWVEALAVAADIEEVRELDEFLERLEKIERKGRAEADAALREVNAAAVEAYVHLDPKEAGFLRDASSLILETRESLTALVSEVEYCPKEHEHQAIVYLRTVANDVCGKIRELLTSGAAVLQSIARS